MRTRDTGSMRLRALAFVAVLAVCTAGIAAYALRAKHRASAELATATADSAALTFTPVDVLPGASDASPRPFAVFRSTALGPSYGRVVLAYLDAGDGARGMGPMSCDRVHYASGSGICLQALRGAVTTYRGTLFDSHFKTRRTFELAGPPSRARISPDGRRAGFTVFINGQAYANPGFTTRSSIVDALSGAPLVDDLETWAVSKDGVAFKQADFNFWGVTFPHDPDRFYATLGTGGRTYLVEGRLSSHHMTVVAADVECPSLSPDDTRIAFKRRAAGGPQGQLLWHVAVLDLASGRVVVLQGESRSVDDQVEWRDTRTILYGMPVDSQRSSAETDVWAIAADDSVPSRRLLPFAFSPAVSR